MRIPNRGSLAPRFRYLFDLFVELVVRDIKVMYKRSVLGVAWSLVNPIVQLLVFYVIFKLILSVRVNRFSSYALSGLLAWNWFRASVAQATAAITGNRELISRPGFPAIILPIVTATTALIHFILAMPILIIVIALDEPNFQPISLYVPIIMIIQFAFSLGLGLYAASANAIFADTNHLITIILQLLIFMTPIFYQASAIPSRYLPFYRLNPMVRLLEAYRALLLDGVQPNWGALVGPTLLTAILVLGGVYVFQKVSYRFVEEL